MHKRLIALVISAFMVTSVMAGCGSKSSDKAGDQQATAQTVSEATKSNEPKPVTISVADYPKETDTRGRELFESWKKAVTEKYPYITIKFEEWGYDVNTFLPKAASGQLPNLFSTWFTEAGKIIDAGYSADITDAMKQYGYDKALNQDILKNVQKDGKLFGLPSGAYVMGVWYNVNLFKKAGLVDDKGIPKFPKTYDELATTAKIIKDKTGKAGFFFPTKNNQGGWQFMNIAWSFGADFEKKVDRKWKAVFNSPEAVAALQYMKDLKWKYGVLPDNNLVDLGDMFKMFGTDQVAMSFAAGDAVQEPINGYQMSKDNIAMSGMPAGPNGNIGLMGGGLWMLSNTSTPEQVDAAFKFLEARGYSSKASPDALKGLETDLKTMNEQAKIVGPYGVRLWTNPDRINAEDELYKKYCNVNMELWNDYLLNATKNVKTEPPVNCQELYKAIDGVIQAVLTDKNADPKALLDKAVADFQRDYLDKVQ